MKGKNRTINKVTEGARETERSRLGYRRPNRLIENIEILLKDIIKR